MTRLQLARPHRLQIAMANSILSRITRLCPAVLLISLTISLSTVAYGQDNWNNSAGGSWAVGTNWSESNPPSTDIANFNLGSVAGYTVTLPGNTTLSTGIQVETDNPTISLGGNTIQPLDTLTIANSSGQTGSLTVLGPGTMNVDGITGLTFVPVIKVGGNGGTGQLTVNDASLIEGNEGTFDVQTLTINNGGELQSGGAAVIGAMQTVTLNDGTFLTPVYEPLVINSLSLSNNSSLKPGEGEGSPTYKITTATVDNSTINNSLYTVNVGTLTLTDGGIVDADTFAGQSLDIESGTLDCFMLTENGTMTVQMANGHAKFGDATFAGTLNLTLPPGYIPTSGEQFQPFLFLGGSGATSMFSTLNLPTLPAGLFWNTSDLYTTGIVSVVPEPSSLSLLALGGFRLLRLRRRNA